MVIIRSSALPFILILISFVSTTSCLLVHQGFSSNIINRNSQQSPFYNPSLTKFDQIKASIRRSFARYHYTQENVSKEYSKDSIEDRVWPIDAAYVMEYYIGSPPVQTYAILDTGSSFTWLQCLPCIKCYNQSKLAIFDPTKSSSYKQLSCRDNRCFSMINTHRCSANSSCQYANFYADGSNSIGDVVQESLHFRDGVENVTIDNIVIGCGHSNVDNVKGEGVPGLIGLTREDASIVRQLSFKQFSYCFGDFDDPDAVGYAKFGEAASITGYTTPVTYTNYDAFFYLNLEGISVDNTSLSIPKDTFTVKGDPRGGFIIDAGTTYTLLNYTSFDILVGDLKERMQNLKVVADPDKLFQQCYEMDWSDVKFAPVITLHFTNMDLQLPIWNTWQNIEQNIYCLAMLPTSRLSKLGNYQQQNMNVGYDLENNVVSFDLMYCSD